MSEHADADHLRMAVGLAVRRARRDAGMSMRAMATACGVSQPFISAIERGQSTPSIATLYRISEVLGVTPAHLLPVHDAGAVTVVRAEDGRFVPSSDRPGSAVGRVVFSDDDSRLEVYEYVIGVDDDLDVWYDHPGSVVLHVREGRLRIDFAGLPAVGLRAGDWVVHPGHVAHRWAIEGDEPVHLSLVISRA